MFYVTSYDYGCSALVNIDRLLNHPTIRTGPNTRIGIYLSTDEAGRDAEQALGAEFLWLEKETQGRVFIVRAEPPSGKLKNPMKHYKDVLLKLVVFDLGVREVPGLWDAGVESPAPPTHITRFILLDSDQLLMHNIDHLFSLPPVDIAAPRTYWGDSKHTLGSTTTLLVVTPSALLWERVRKAMDTLKEGEYDMDLVNRVFGNEIMTLPGRYCTLNSHWEVNGIPFWFHGPVHQEIQETISRWRDGGDEGMGNMDTNYTSMKKGTKKTWASDELVQLAIDSDVVHFTALGKPWTYSLTQVMQERPDAHWVFVEMFGEWRSTAARVCPGWKELHGEV